MGKNIFRDRFREYGAKQDALWAFFGPRAHDALGIASLVPLSYIACCDWGEDTRQIHRSTPVYSVEKKSGERRNWSNRDLDLSLSSASQDDLRKLLSASKRSVHCICYRSFNHLENLARQFPALHILSSSASLKSKLDDKALFWDIQPKLGIRRLKGESRPLSELVFEDLRTRYGQPFVVQFPFSSSGNFTFLVSKKDALDALKQRHESIRVNVTSFIDRPCININAAILEDGGKPLVISSPPSVQLIGLPEVSVGDLVFCGNDFSALSAFPVARLEEAQELIQRIGSWMAAQGFRGLFGADLVVDDDHVYPVEINPRFQNSTSLLTHLSLERGDIPLAACHLSAFLPDAPIPSRKEQAEQYERNFQTLEGAQIIVHNRLEKSVRIQGTLKPGIYKIIDDRLTFLRPGLTINDLEGMRECLITCAVPEKGKVIAGRAPILKFQTRSTVFTPELTELSRWARACIGSIYKTLKSEPEEKKTDGS